MTAETGSADDLLGVLRSFWPGAEIDEEPGRRVRREAEEQALYAFGPGASRTRMLVPVTPPGAAARTWCRFSSASTVGDTGRRLLLATGTSATGGRVLRGRVVVRGVEDDSMEQHLGEVLGQRVSFSLGIGTARVNRKPVLQVFDVRGRTVAFAKIGDSATSRVDVEAESHHLRRLAGRRWHTLALPQVVDVSVWRGLLVLVLSALPTTPWPRGPRRLGPPLAAMDELAASSADAGGALHELAWTAQHRRTAAGLADTETRDRLLRCFDLLCDRAGPTPWRIGAWHGDWTPWNMAWSHGRVQLWDWERFETGVPLGLDRCHFLVNAHTRRHGTTVRTVHDVVTASDGGLTGGPPGRLTAAAYLLAVTVRYLALAESERGADIAGRGHVTLAVLERLLASSTRRS